MDQRSSDVNIVQFVQALRSIEPDYALFKASNLLNTLKDVRYDKAFKNLDEIVRKLSKALKLMGKWQDFENIASELFWVRSDVNPQGEN